MDENSRRRLECNWCLSMSAFVRCDYRSILIDFNSVKLGCLFIVCPLLIVFWLITVTVIVSIIIIIVIAIIIITPKSTDVRRWCPKPWTRLDIRNLSFVVWRVQPWLSHVIIFKNCLLYLNFLHKTINHFSHPSNEIRRQVDIGRIILI